MRMHDAISFLSAVLPCCCALASVSTNAVDVRPRAAGRVWQVVQDAGLPLTWPWETSADAALLTMSNLCFGTVSSQRVERIDASRDGKCAQVSGDADEERIYDVTLVQYAGEKALSVETARIVFLPGTHGGGTVVRAARRMKTAGHAALCAYDAAWRSSTAGAASATLVAETAPEDVVMRGLYGTSGFDVFRLSPGVETDLALLFDGVKAFEARVRCRRPLTTLIVR